MISLLERFYDPTRGNITFDEQDIKSISPGSYRAEIALVQQEPVLFHGSIRENIALGIEGEDPTDEAITVACKQANIHDFVLSLPDGLGTSCGSQGLQLSGGQRQRIAIARALIRQPRLLLLDEATSALDTESEKVVKKALDTASQGRTTIAVAHHLSTVKDADCILVFSHGKIIEVGTHEQLLQRKGVYYEMCLAQSLDRSA
jgi:ATP-binding cassette, subfamily B (MDR/TAP), member 1